MQVVKKPLRFFSGLPCDSDFCTDGVGIKIYQRVKTKSQKAFASFISFSPNFSLRHKRMCTFKKQSETGLKNCLKYHDMNFGTFAKKTVEKCKNNTFFKQQVISKPHKLLHFSRESSGCL